MLLSHDAMEINHAPNPNDIIWENVSIPKSQVIFFAGEILSLSHSLSLSVRLSLSVCLSLSHCLILFLSVTVSLFHSFSHSLSLTLSHTIFLSSSLSPSFLLFKMTLLLSLSLFSSISSGFLQLLFPFISHFIFVGAYAKLHHKYRPCSGLALLVHVGDFSQRVLCKS